MYKRILSTFVLAISLLCINTSSAKASLITVGKTGEVTLNVLSAEYSVGDMPSPESITVSKSSVDIGEADMPISFFRKDGRYYLNVAGKDGEKNFDVTDYEDNILEIEERPAVKKIGIKLLDNQFVIEQAGVKAETVYQINVEPKISRITILTPTGYKFLTMLPRDAVDVLLKSGSITSVPREKTLNISEDEKGNLFYDIEGVRQIGIKDLYTYNVPVSAKISAINGEIMELNEPIWLKILNLFTLQT